MATVQLLAPYGPRIPNLSSNAASSVGASFNHIVIIAMENQNYGSVIGSSSAPFINSLAKAGTTISNYHSYGQGVGGCSAGCYEAFTSGQQSHSDGWCPRASSPCYAISNIADQLHVAGLASAMFCEDGCPRGADHFPWIAYTSTWNSCVTGSFSCNGQTGPDGNLLYGSSSSNGNTAFINYLNSANPANYIWFTPSDSHNMHDNSVSSGDTYLQSLLVGTGTVSSPSAGSVMATSLFKSPGTFLYLWWDEYDPSPNVEYGPMIKVGYTSTAGYTEYNSLHTIEANWGLPYVTSIVSADTSMTDLFGIITPPPPSFTLTSSVKSLSLMQTFSQNLPLTLTSLTGFTGTVDLTSSVDRQGVTMTLGQTILSLSSGSTINVPVSITTTNTTALGSYTLKVIATSGSLVQSVTIPLRVNVLGDIAGDGVVNIVDYSVLLYLYGTTPSSSNWNPLADLNHDGVVNVSDLSIVLANYEKTTP